MLSYGQAVVMGILQGVSELFPVSSLGHSVILPGILAWHIDQQAPFFLMFLVATHFATALVLFLFFWRDWMRIIGGIFRSLAEREIRNDDPDAKLGWLLVVSTIPAGILGLLFENQIRDYFIAPQSAAFFLLLNGAMLFGAEALRRRAVIHDSRDSDARISELTWWQGIKVGALQAIALIPGFSRTGATIAGSLLMGLSHEDSLRFSFLLATPIIGAAAVLKIPELLASGGAQAIDTALLGAVCSAIFAYISIRFLTAYFKPENRTLTPFAAYCLAAGLLASIYFLIA